MQILIVNVIHRVGVKAKNKIHFFAILFRKKNVIGTYIKREILFTI